MDLPEVTKSGCRPYIAVVLPGRRLCVSLVVREQPCQCWGVSSRTVAKPRIWKG
jgi:hypothetical protein